MNRPGSFACISVQLSEIASSNGTWSSSSQLVGEQVLVVEPAYGVPRMTEWLRQHGFEVNHKRVGRIMRELGLEGESGQRRVRTTIVDRQATAASDHVRREFNPPGPPADGHELLP